VTERDEKSFKINVWSTYVGVILALGFGFALQGVSLLLQNSTNPQLGYWLSLGGGGAFIILGVLMFFCFKTKSRLLT